MPDGPLYFRWRFEGGRPRIEWIGPGLDDLLDATVNHPAELLARLHEDDRPLVWQQIEAARSGARTGFDGLVRWIDSTGEPRWIEVAASREIRPDGSAVWHGFARRRPDREGLAATFGRADELTGLANRAEFLRVVREALADRRYPAIAVLFLDLDGFKPINDRLGHPAGDVVLREVANRLRAQIRRRDVLSRYGGDEFALLLKPIAGRKQALACADRLARALAEPLRINGQEIRLTTSIGIAIAPDDATSAELLIGLADRRMYESKPRPSPAGDPRPPDETTR